MSHDYRAVQWNAFKISFDVALAAGVAAFLGIYIASAVTSQTPGESFTPIQLLIRAFGAAAFALLTLILAIGPLTRFSARFLPLLYNRRHLGVTCFLLALTHAGLVLLWYHGFSDTNPLISLLTSNPRYSSIQGFPFEALGLAALFILFVLAGTSHDFWNANLGPALWKAIHMSVYAAYALIVAHVVLGAVQSERGDAYAIAVGVGAFLLSALHIVAGLREVARDRSASVDDSGWLVVCAPQEIPDGCARIVTPPEGERIAVFRDGARIYALSNVCKHQGGPLGEGRIVDGCVVCPWHGFQYRPQDGVSPPPYTEKVFTYRTRIHAGVVEVCAAPEKLGAETAPALVGESP